MSKQHSTTFLAIGDIHDHWEYVIKVIESAAGTFENIPDLVLQIGDAKALRTEVDLATLYVPNKYRSTEMFSALETGDLKSPVNR